MAPIVPSLLLHRMMSRAHGDPPRLRKWPTREHPESHSFWNTESWVQPENPLISQSDRLTIRSVEEQTRPVVCIPSTGAVSEQGGYVKRTFVASFSRRFWAFRLSALLSFRLLCCIPRNCCWEGRGYTRKSDINTVLQYFHVASYMEWLSTIQKEEATKLSVPSQTSSKLLITIVEATKRKQIERCKKWKVILNIFVNFDD